MSDTPQLKPCPFCGGEAQYEKDHTVEQLDSIYCKSCGTFISDFDLEGPQGSCIAAWNTRAAPKVKPLVWKGSVSDCYMQAVSIMGVYEIMVEDREMRWSASFEPHDERRPVSIGWYYDGHLQAMEACQSHHDRRIREALE